MAGIEISQQAGPRISPHRLRKAIRACLRAEGKSADASLSVALVGDTAMTTLNERYRGKRGATDVLSFAGARGFRSGMGREFDAGEIIISVHQARRQANQAGHSLEREVVLLALHGLLHNLGYEHRTERQAAGMLAKAGRIADSVFRRSRRS